MRGIRLFKNRRRKRLLEKCMKGPVGLEVLDAITAEHGMEKALKRIFTGPANDADEAAKALVAVLTDEYGAVMNTVVVQLTEWDDFDTVMHAMKESPFYIDSILSSDDRLGSVYRILEGDAMPDDGRKMVDILELSRVNSYVQAGIIERLLELMPADGRRRVLERVCALA